VRALWRAIGTEGVEKCNAESVMDLASSARASVMAAKAVDMRDVSVVDNRSRIKAAASQSPAYARKEYSFKRAA